MRLQVTTSIPDQEDFAHQWDLLVMKMESPQVFYTYEWAQAVSTAYSDPAVLLFTAYRGESLVGVASLAKNQRSGDVAFLAATTADYCDFVSAPHDREEFIALVVRELHGRGITGLTLANLPAESPSVRVLKSCAKDLGFSLYSRPAYFCARVALNSSEQRQRVARSAHRNSKKTRNALSRLGTISLDHRKKYQEFAAEFPSFLGANIERFLAVGRLSNLISHQRRIFLNELGRLLSERGWLTLSTLRLDSATIAWQLGFQFAGSWLCYLPAFDSKFQHLHPGPGSYLTYQILEYAAQDPSLKEVDLGLGDEGYKQQFATESRMTLHINASRSKFHVLGERCRYETVRALKRTPRIEASIRACLAQASDFASNVLQTGVRASAITSFQRVWKQLSVSSESIFMERACDAGDQSEFEIAPLSTRELARVAMANDIDGECLKYLVKCASRLGSRRFNGFVLLNAEGLPVQIAWFSRIADLQVLRRDKALPNSLLDAVVLIDRWTPASQARNSCYFTALVAACILRSGRWAWICADRGHVPELQALGLRSRFTRKKRFIFESFSKLESIDGSRPLVGLGPVA